MIVDLSNKYICDALNFYEIYDIDYKSKCISCINKIKSNQKTYKKFIEVINVLYSQNDVEISTLWKYPNIEDVFGKEYCNFITNVALLVGFERHEINMRLKNFDDNQVLIHKKRVKECLTNDVYNRNYNSIRMSQMLWGTYFINIKLIEIGRLQYEYCKDYIKIHIPSGNKLDYMEVLNSIKLANESIQQYYNCTGLEYYCNSWLLSKQIKEVLNIDDNIIKFQSLFDIKEGENCTRDILNFVFNTLECSDYNWLSEKTSLQKKIKQMLLNGIDIKLGLGKLCKFKI